MFSYYGSKSKIITKYPKPLHDTIVEPFAGSARYALEHWDNTVILSEKYERVYRVWVYLQQASEHDILSLPDVPRPYSNVLEDIEGFSQLCDEEKWLIGFGSNSGSAYPKKSSGTGTRNCWFREKKRIAENLYKIRHWVIINEPYDYLANFKATWFIDPPYQKQGKWYTTGCKNTDIDYTQLSKWCKEREGQVIVCENQDADWLDFQPLTMMSGNKYYNKMEMIWTKETE